MPSAIDARPETRLHHHRFEHGLEVIAEIRPWARSAAAGWFVAAGARDEPAERAGLSHFLEHLAFKGGEGWDADGMNRAFDEIGARYNAYTSEERTVYYGAALPERFDRLLELLTELLVPDLDEQDVEIERRVILEEIAMVHDAPDERVVELAVPRYWAGHPLGRSILGSEATLGAIDVDALQAYRRAHYAPDRLTLALSGRVDWERTLAWVEVATRDWKPSGRARARPTPAPCRGDERIADADVARSHAAVFAPGVPAEAGAHVAAALLAAVLGDEEAGALHWALVDPGHADEAGLVHEALDGAGAYVGWASCAPEQACAVIAGLRQVLSEAQDRPVDAAAWRRAQRAQATGLTLQAETPFGRLMSLGEAWLERRALRSVEALVEEVLATPPQAGERLLAARPFDELYTLTLGPDDVASERA